MARVDMTARRETLVDAAGREIPPFAFGYEWICGCGARLFVRSRVDRDEGASNFDPTRQDPARPDLKQQPSALNWAGLAVERGWQVDPVTCPACQAGLTVAEYKAARRAGKV